MVSLNNIIKKNKDYLYVSNMSISELKENIENGKYTFPDTNNLSDINYSMTVERFLICSVKSKDNNDTKDMILNTVASHVLKFLDGKKLLGVIIPSFKNLTFKKLSKKSKENILNTKFYYLQANKERLV